jgi:PadR family transcriptional regulator
MVPPVPNSELSPQLRRGVLEYCVMALLEKGERYAFDLVKELAQMDGLGIGEGTIYPMLARMRRDGAVETTWRESPTGPPRRYYKLTPIGQTALRGFLKEWSTFRDAVDRMMGVR